jgi:hypothetical protein
VLVYLGVLAMLPPVETQEAPQWFSHGGDCINRKAVTTIFTATNKIGTDQRFSRFTTNDAANLSHQRVRHTLTSSNACHTGSTSDLVAGGATISASEGATKAAEASGSSGA